MASQVRFEGPAVTESTEGPTADTRAAESLPPETSDTGDPPSDMGSREPVPSSPPPQNLEALADALVEDPRSFGFFQAVRLLERLRPHRRPVGGWGNPADEVVRFSVPPHLSFPPSEIHDVQAGGNAGEAADGEAPPRMDVNFLGLTGPQGMLPREYTAWLADRSRSRDPGPAAFLDIFNHRMLSLFYRAWRKNRFDLHVEEPPRNGGLVQHLLDLLGLGLESYQDQAEVPDETLIRYSGLLAPQPRSATALRQLLSDRLDVPVEVEEFVGGWFPLAKRDRCRLGTEDPSTRLGRGAVVGHEVWDPQSRVLLRIGPLSRQEYHQLLPGGQKHQELRGLVRFFSHDQFEFALQLVLRAEDVPGLVLDGGDEEAGEDQPLGWCTWLRSAPRTLDADETVLAL